MDLRGIRESRNFVDETPLTSVLFGNRRYSPYDTSKIALTGREHSMLQNGMSLQDIMYIRAIKAHVMPDDSWSMTPDNSTSNKPYK